MNGQFSFDVPIGQAYKDDDGKMHVVGVASDTRVDLGNDRIGRGCIKSMASQLRKKNLPFLPDHRASFEMGTIHDAFVNESADGELEMSIDIALDDDFPESRKLFREVHAGKKNRQMSIGGRLNMANPRAVTFENDPAHGHVRVIQDLEMDHVAATRRDHAMNPRTDFSQAIIKELDLDSLIEKGELICTHVQESDEADTSQAQAQEERFSASLVKDIVVDVVKAVTQRNKEDGMGDPSKVEESTAVAEEEVKNVAENEEQPSSDEQTDGVTESEETVKETDDVEDSSEDSASEEEGDTVEETKEDESDEEAEEAAEEEESDEEDEDGEAEEASDDEAAEGEESEDEDDEKSADVEETLKGLDDEGLKRVISMAQTFLSKPDEEKDDEQEEKVEETEEAEKSVEEVAEDVLLRYVDALKSDAEKVKDEVSKAVEDLKDAIVDELKEMDSRIKSLENRSGTRKSLDETAEETVQKGSVFGGVFKVRGK